MARSNSRESAKNKLPAATPSRWPWISSTFTRFESLFFGFFLAAAVAAVYGRSTNAPLFFDDSDSVINNRSIRQLWPLIGDAQQPGPLNPAKDLPISGRPLVNLSFALNYHFGQLNSTGYHLLNLVVHALSALLLMAIVRRTLQLDFFRGRFTAAAAPLPFCAALLWAVHPLQTESVVYITQRTELLAGFCYLATLYCSLRYWSAMLDKPRKLWLTLAVLACLAGAASKEMIVTAPLIVLLFERTFIIGSFRQALRQSWPLYAGLFASWLLLLALNYDSPRGNSAGFNCGVSAYAWWFTQAKVLWMYLARTVWPWPLLIHYKLPYLDTLSAAWPWLLLTLPLLAATAILFWRRYSAGFVGACFFIILSPTLVVPIVTETAAERRMYLPLAALLTLAVAGGYQLLSLAALRWQKSHHSKSPPRWPAVCGTVAVLASFVALSLVSVRRLAAYDNPVLLWQDVINDQPDNHVAYNNLGTELGTRGRVDEAIQNFQQAVRLKPNYTDALENLGLAYIRAGRPQEALEPLHIAEGLDPNNAQLRYRLGTALAQTKQMPEAIEQFQKAIALEPNAAELHNDLAAAWMQTGKIPDAVQELRVALRLKPEFVSARTNLGLALLNLDRPFEAIEEYQQALKLKPDDASIYGKLALAYAKLDRVDDALASADKALQLAQSQGQSAYVQVVTKWKDDYRQQRAHQQNQPVGKEPSP